MTATYLTLISPPAINRIMFERLQKKWKVNGWRLLLILITFAVGGSLTGYLGKKIMNALSIESAVLYIPVYIIVVTIVWPFMVLVVSVFTGQFIFFKNYIAQLGSRIVGRKHHNNQALQQNRNE